MGFLLSVNVARPRDTDYADGPGGRTGIDKRPVSGPVRVAAPGPNEATRTAGSGVAGDSIFFRGHGGDDQAVYAYAREDLDSWAEALGRPLEGGVFGENMTTSGLDVTGARIGERWRVGSGVVLEVTSPRIPCRTFAGWLGEKQWVKRFTQAARPGAYLRVITPGSIEAGDAVEVVSRPGHEVSVELLFRAFTTERDLLPRVQPAIEAMNSTFAEDARKRLAT
ncbi:MAG: MOSC domain-containing protein [Nocardiopsaceae bacterium]|nr:MOSC domain-containing protein [Nocardiopsaceae bacterium]